MTILLITTNKKKKKRGSAGERMASYINKKSSKKPYSNLSLFTNKAKNTIKDGKNYLVVPGVPVQEQVMNTYLLPADEIQGSLESWNGTPLSIRHAQANGGSVQVDNPDVPIIGYFDNAVWDAIGNRMLGDYWIDVAEAMKYPEGNTILNSIKNGQIVETSTAYWADEEWKSGSFKGKNYTSIHRNPKRDHIAIFPNDQLGACSILDGCGLNRNMVHNCNCPHKNNLEMMPEGLSEEEQKKWKESYKKAMETGWHMSPAKAAEYATKMCHNNLDLPLYKPGYLPTALLIGYALNKGSRTQAELEKTREYVRKHGVTKPVWVQCNGTLKILDGNHRVALADEFGIDQVPVRVIDSSLEAVDPEAVYHKWLHEQDQGYLK